MCLCVCVSMSVFVPVSVCDYLISVAKLPPHPRFPFQEPAQTAVQRADLSEEGSWDIRNEFLVVVVLAKV